MPRTTGGSSTRPSSLSSWLWWPSTILATRSATPSRPGCSAGRRGELVARLLDISDLRTQLRLREGVVHAVDGVSLQGEAGETLGIGGESGCGKTMTALSIMNLLPTGGHIAGGSIKLAGQEISTLSDDAMRKIRGNEIAMIFQDPLTSLNPTMTIGKQIAENVTLHREVSKEQAMDRAAEVLDLVGIPRVRERIKEYPHQFSGGMRQREMISMSLA